jgi:hypothetical protein
MTAADSTNSIMDDIPPVLGNEPQIPVDTKTITVRNFTRSNIRSSRHRLNLGTGEHRDGRIDDLASDFRSSTVATTATFDIWVVSRYAVVSRVALARRNNAIDVASQ